ncbi:hypothetical protein HYW19_00665 [Candidatus Woesearchaeota archaeon]|nr:hypothetical protein [Candidatus Woesearchaeota archaeon]
MEFWSSLLTEKSWNLLKELSKKDFNFIVIGGWATYLWIKLHKSKDIDIIIPNFEELEYLKKNYDLRKDENLKKYEIKFEEIDVDIYVPYYSKLALPIEEIKSHITKIENMQVVRPEVLLILKQGAELDRKDSVKGSKDRIDIMALLIFSEIDFKGYRLLLKMHNISHYANRLLSIVTDFKDIKYLDLNPREFKLKKRELLKKMGKKNKK